MNLFNFLENLYTEGTTDKMLGWMMGKVKKAVNAHYGMDSKFQDLDDRQLENLVDETINKTKGLAMESKDKREKIRTSLLSMMKAERR